MQSSVIPRAEDVPPSDSVSRAHQQPWQSLCLLARLPHIAADPDTLTHERGLTASMQATDDERLGAARPTRAPQPRSAARSPTLPAPT